MAQQTTPAPVASLPPPPPIPESRIVTSDQIQKVSLFLSLTRFKISILKSRFGIVAVLT